MITRGSVIEHGKVFGLTGHRQTVQTSFILKWYLMEERQGGKTNYHLLLPSLSNVPVSHYQSESNEPELYLIARLYHLTTRQHTISVYVVQSG